MNTYLKVLFLSIVAFVLVFSSFNFVGVENEVKAAKNQSKNRDLVIVQNIPQFNPEVKNNIIQLQVLNVYKEGHFKQASENLTWKSSNKNVAQVDGNGIVTLLGHNGKTFISVTDGMMSDRIAIQYKGNASEDKIRIIQQEGDRYDVIGHAIKNMTVEEKVGQMLMPDFRNWNGKNVTEMLPEIQQLVKDYHLGGVILFRENVVTTAQTTKLVAQYQEAAEKYGLLMGIDQEGGIITRLQTGTDMPGNMALGAARSKDLTWKVGNAIGEELQSLGINMNLAPVLDVNNNPDNPVIGVRSFGENPEMVSEMGVSYIKGMQNSGVAATAKHFPGHGDTATDSHLGLPEVPHDKERLLRVELYPFQKAMDAGIDAIMTAHVTFPKIDDTKAISKKDGTEIALPATLSHKVLTGLMRDEMDYKGVIITDAMNMQAISDHFGPVEAAIRTVKAGSDIVLMPVGLKEVSEGLLAAVKSGDIEESRVEKSVERILSLKLKRGIVKAETEKSTDEKIENALEVVGSDEHKQVEKEAAAKSITLVKDSGILPLNASPEDKIVVVGNSYIESMVDEVKKHHQNMTVIKASKPLSQEELQKVKDAKFVILGTHTSNVSGRLPSSSQMQLANQIIVAAAGPVIGVGIRNPYDIMAYPEIDSYLVQYGFRQASFEAMVNTIFGKNAPTGKLPVTIYQENGETLYNYGHGLTFE
jgi:beta-N-acetylhexosaminidase